MTTAREGDMDIQEQLARLGRGTHNGRMVDEPALVAATGGAPSAWVVRITGLVSHNWYEVEHVTLGPAGMAPTSLGGQRLEAVNLAESFGASGTLTVGTCAIMWRAEGKNLIDVNP